MIKYNKIILTSILFILLLATLSSCAKNTDENDPVIGTWQLVSISDGNSEMEVQDYLKSAGLDAAPTLVFESGGKVTINMGDQSGEASWNKDGQTYTLTDDTGEEPLVMSVELKDDKLYLKQSGYTLVFSK